MTPNSALLKFAGSAKMTVDQVLRRRSELLTTFGLNVISVRPEPGAVVVAVERPEREVVNIQQLWSLWRPVTAEWGNQDILIGVRENDGSRLFLSPGRKHAPHTLIAGSTGSGKSVLMQNIILGIAATNTPDQARILLIDPKQGVDYFVFEDLPHLDGGIIDDQETASRRLSETRCGDGTGAMVRFKEVRVSNLAAYNAKVAPDQRLPAIWLIHDEFAEWMLVEDYKEAVASVVQRLGVKARAAGIYLVFAAQRPDALVMPMQLRAELGEPPHPSCRFRRNVRNRTGRQRRRTAAREGPLPGQIGGRKGTLLRPGAIRRSSFCGGSCQYRLQGSLNCVMAADRTSLTDCVNGGAKLYQ